MPDSSIGKVYLDLETNAQPFQQQLNGIAGKSTNMVKSAFMGLGKVMAGAFAVTKLVQFGKASIDLASDLQEVQNVVDVVFGESASQINNFAKTAITQYGLSELSAKKYASTMGAMLKSMGLSQKATVDMSQSIAALAGDMASFYNLDSDDAFNKIRAGISGETEPLKQLGINMSQANLEAFALSQGITKSMKSMTQSEQALLRYNYLLSTTADAQGDFARTSDGWANQTRILSEQFNSLKATLGSAFIAVLAPVVKMLNWIISKLQIAANYFKAFVEAITGVKAETSSASSGMTDIADGATEAGEATEKAAKKASKALAGFDKLNVLSSNSDDSGSGGSGGGGTGGMDIPSLVGDVGTAFPEPDTSGAEKAVEKIKGMFSNLKSFITTAFAPTITSWGNAFADLKQPLSDAFSSIGTSISGIWNDSLIPFGAYYVGEFIPSIVNTFSERVAPAFSSSLSKVASSFSGLLGNTIAPFANYVLGDFIPSIYSGFADTFAPIFSDVMAFALGQFASDFGFVCQQVTNFVNDILKPALESIQTILTGVMGAVKAEWDKSGQNLLDMFGRVRDSIKEIWNNLYETILKPVWQSIIGAVDSLWQEHLQPLWEKFLSFAAKLGEAVMTIWNNFLAPIVNWIIEKVGPVIVGTIQGIISTVKTVIGTIADVCSGIFDALGGLLDFITGVFSGDWKKAWNGIKSFFKGIWDAIWAVIKGIINLIIGGINNLWSGIYKAVKGIVNTIGKVAGVIGDLLGQNWKFSMPDKPPLIPKLARGGIIDQPTLAMVGERGKEAVVPLENTAFADSIANAILRVLTPLFANGSTIGKNDDGTTVLVLKVGEYELGRVTVGAINKYHNVIGKVELEV